MSLRILQYIFMDCSLRTKWVPATRLELRCHGYLPDDVYPAESVADNLSPCSRFRLLPVEILIYMRF